MIQKRETPFMTLRTDYQLFMEKQNQFKELKAELDNYKNFIKSVCSS